VRLATLAAILLIVSVAGAGFAASEPADGAIADWPYYGGDAGGGRYSPLTQIDKNNVTELKVAWEYHTGDVSDGSGDRRKSEFEATPIVVDGTMYLSTPFNRVVALEPETGQQKWSFDPKIDLHAPYSEGLVNRGVRSGPTPPKPRATPAKGGSFSQRSTRAFSPSMPGPVCPAPISGPQGRSI
jgi:quinoprotein glucose dehydrogenase